MLKQKRLAKPFFLEDAEGTLYKATKVADEDFELEEDIDKVPDPKEPEAEGQKDEELVAVMLSAEDLELLKQIIAERKELHDAEADKDKELEANKEPDVKEEDGCDPKVVDTKANDSLAGFGSVENKKVSSKQTDDEHLLEVEAAWSKRYK